MQFNSIDFAIFLPVVFLIYWFLNSKKLLWQNLLIVVASYVFYGWWDWRFLSLIFFSTVVDYVVGIKLSVESDSKKRKLLLLISIIVNLGFLGFFKYFNFFLDNFISAFSFFGMEIKANSLKLVLPVGISFYTFQTMSYTIDIFRKKLQPTKDFIAFAAFVSFFPQLVAGPIERASNLIPQFSKKRIFNKSQATDGLRQILWGLFKKVVIADNCAIYAAEIFDNYTNYSGSTLLLGAILFAFQIYGDFSGYSDIAIGTARLFGFNLMRNFAFPYFSRDIAEFWRRWHISLSSWFRDYLYIPLGGSRGNTWMKIRNTLVIFIVSGFWHGANWTFIAWGLLNALYFLPLLLLKKNRKNTETIAPGKYLPSFREFAGMLSTFSLVVLGWIFFRSETIGDAFAYFSGIFNISLFSAPGIFPKMFLMILFIFFGIEWLQRDRQHGLAIRNEKIPSFLRWGLYFSLILAIYFFGNFSENIEFIYFQF